ncbi:hypothetical protein ADEAN_000348900 [Angomonas deanei]|uniref:Uncharacterized protein n=1 Tax=Angomonas deanei TaxID=59799 RepID=A0A7G2CAD7_9TRYP|nr:hypothetical protein ADEAN_000348900 [Angomonas deanei]
MDSSVDNKPGQNKKGNKKKENNKPNSNKNASPKTDNKASKVKEEVFLCLTLAVSGRSPLNGWIMNIGATLITAERKVLGVFERNLLPLHADVRVKPAPDVVGYWRRQRAELEYFYADKEAGRSAGQQLLAKANPSLRRVPPAEAFEDLTQFCSPYVNLTLVGSPLLSVYGWISYYWSRVWQKDRQMPWGFSGLCARSFSAGYLGVPMKKLNNSATFHQLTRGL